MGYSCRLEVVCPFTLSGYPYHVLSLVLSEGRATVRGTDSELATARAKAQEVHEGKIRKLNSVVQSGDAGLCAMAHPGTHTYPCSRSLYAGYWGIIFLNKRRSQPSESGGLRSSRFRCRSRVALS